MKLEVGMYVRTKEGYVCKILKLNEDFEDDGYLDHNDIGSASIQEKNVIKASHNIIDLIEVGDYVNGHKVEEVIIDALMSYVKLECVGLYVGDYDEIDAKDIKTIVTKEMFSNAEYRVETN